MKKTIKTISLMLAVIMLLATMPLSAMAAEDTDTADTAWEDGTTLLKMDGLFGTDGAKMADGVTIEANNNIHSAVEKKDKNTMVAHESLQSKWVPFGGISTNLPLNGTARYTIEMEVKYLNNGKVSVMLAGDDYASGQGLFIRTNYAESQYSMESASYRNKYARSVFVSSYSIDTAAYANITIEINGYNALLYMNGVLHQEWCYDAPTVDTVTKGWASEYLQLALIGNSNGYSVDGDAINVGSVTVTAGNVKSGRISRDYEDGTLLMKKNGLFNTSVVSSVSGLKITEYAEREDGAIVGGDNGETIVTTENGSVSGWVDCGGIFTNLPLTPDSEYTIEMDINYGNCQKVSVGLAGDSYANMQGFFARDTYINSQHILNANSLNKYNSVSGAYKSNYPSTLDGEYHRFVIEISGFAVTIYVDGIRNNTFDYSSANTKINDKTIYGWEGTTLNLAIVGNSGTISGNQTVLGVKNVAVYAGTANLYFEDGAGKVYDKRYVEQGDTVSEFPAVEADEGKLVKWFIDGTTVIVDTPYTVTSNETTLVAKVIDINEMNLVGMQYTNPSSGNTQSVRFIATIHTLNAESVGFVVIAKYMDGTEPAEKEFKVTSKTVYTAITTNESGTVKPVTASELGGTYLVAISIDDVPTNIGQIDFYVKSFKVIDGQEVYNDNGEQIWTLTNGKYT